MKHKALFLLAMCIGIPAQAEVIYIPDAQGQVTLAAGPRDALSDQMCFYRVDANDNVINQIGCEPITASCRADPAGCRVEHTTTIGPQEDILVKARAIRNIQDRPPLVSALGGDPVDNSPGRILVGPTPPFLLP